MLGGMTKHPLKFLAVMLFVFVATIQGGADYSEMMQERPAELVGGIVAIFLMSWMLFALGRLIVRAVRA